jgi:hypothetical protein
MTQVGLPVLPDVILSIDVQDGQAGGEYIHTGFREGHRLWCSCPAP